MSFPGLWEIPVYLDHSSAFHGISINYSTYCQARSEQEVRQLIVQYAWALNLSYSYTHCTMSPLPTGILPYSVKVPVSPKNSTGGRCPPPV